MLNSTCEVREDPFFQPIHISLIVFYISVYTLAFYILLAKCPDTFRQYRNHLLVQIVSMLLVEIHFSVFWNLSIDVPWAAMCSNGLGSGYSVQMFQIFIVLNCFVGITSLNLFIYRMKAVTMHMENPKFQKSVMFFYYLFIILSGVLFIFNFLIYSDLKEQNEYKIKIEEVWRVKAIRTNRQFPEIRILPKLYLV
ncbi:hypothetical protein CAEBREN_14020 [Caenorhabditis brenneri]|uniref:Uncharacterized protein n=1 Tax=Caenorhabditis brenneri TaxID=135651 RepID=G0NJ08_CAEBE|nr:hypothetical protein CAEBREN_14020 [Caenorhabditis brenneri]